MPKEREIFADLIEQKGEPDTAVLLTLGLFHYHKWDRIVDRERQNDGRPLTVEQQYKTGDEFSPEDVRRYRQISNRTIKDLQQQENATGPITWTCEIPMDSLMSDLIEQKGIPQSAYPESGIGL